MSLLISSLRLLYANFFLIEHDKKYFIHVTKNAFYYYRTFVGREIPSICKCIYTRAISVNV